MERTLEQLNEDVKTLIEMEREEIDKLDLSDEVKEELLRVVEALETNLGDLNEEELAEIAEYVERNHKINEKREELTIKMIKTIGINSYDNPEEGIKELSEKGYELVRLMDESVENKVLYKYCLVKKDEDETVACFYELEETEGEYVKTKFSDVMLGEK